MRVTPWKKCNKEDTSHLQSCAVVNSWFRDAMRAQCALWHITRNSSGNLEELISHHNELVRATVEVQIGPGAAKSYFVSSAYKHKVQCFLRRWNCESRKNVTSVYSVKASGCITNSWQKEFESSRKTNAIYNALQYWSTTNDLTHDLPEIPIGHWHVCLSQTFCQNESMGWILLQC